MMCRPLRGGKLRMFPTFQRWLRSVRMRESPMHLQSTFCDPVSRTSIARSLVNFLCAATPSRPSAMGSYDREFTRSCRPSCVFAFSHPASPHRMNIKPVLIAMPPRPLSPSPPQMRCSSLCMRSSHAIVFYLLRRVPPELPAGARMAL